MVKFSVLMSLYIKESSSNLRECFDSLLAQSVPASEWVIVEDGPLSVDLYRILDEYTNKYPGLIKRVVLLHNKGLGVALKEGITHCSNELIARMDTDDIARQDRFEKQIAAFQQNPNLDVCGSYVSEFEGSVNNVVSVRKVPLTDSEIKIYQKRRDGFNHPSVMYKRSSVLKAGSYEHCPLMEDSMLWVKMILAGAQFTNLNESLVYMRVDQGMIKRRGGFSYFAKYNKARWAIYKTGFITLYDFMYTACVQSVVAIIPNACRKLIFRRFLRS